MTDELSAELLARWQAGDQQAAEELFARYSERLIALVRQRLSAKLARRVDAEDIVLSAYRSFFVGAREGRFSVQRGGDLWRVLAGITVNKLQGQVERHTAGKRALEREGQLDDSSAVGGLSVYVLASEPPPEAAAILADEVEQLMRHLGPLERQMLELRLQGWTFEEIATQTQRSERTVRRFLGRVKESLEQRASAGKAEP
jgi:RNA polymerase sigma-70 factor (ECF subfamily)